MRATRSSNKPFTRFSGIGATRPFAGSGADARAMASASSIASSNDAEPRWFTYAKPSESAPGAPVNTRMPIASCSAVLAPFKRFCSTFALCCTTDSA
jgi:hypothetical protein